MKKQKVLVVDNHPLVQQFMKDLLLPEGHQVVTAGDGLAALDILQDYTPEVVFMDLIIPNIDGRRLCRIIRNMPALEATRLVILSAMAAEDDLDFRALGAQACIAKGPFQQMAGHVLETMRQLATGDQAEANGGILGLDTVHPRQITRDLLSVKKHFDLILAHMAEGVLEVSPSSRIIYANPVAIQLAGIPEEQLLGSSFPDLFQEEDRQRVKELFEDPGATPITLPDSSSVRLGEHLVTLKLLPVQTSSCQCIVILGDVTRGGSPERGELR